METGQYLDPNCGRCNRIEKCGYHQPPTKDMIKDDMLVPIERIKPELAPAEGFDTLDTRNVLSTSGIYGDNLTKFLMKTFPPALVTMVLNSYHVGAVRQWDDNATVYWQIDREYNVRTGKVMLYDEETGKRVKEPYNKVSWMHLPHNQMFEVDTDNYNLQQCFFGEHLLNFNAKEINICESEKTAVICTIVKPQSAWIATGGLANISRERLLPYKDKKLIFHPDKGQGYKEWSEKLASLEEEFDITISKFLENKNMLEDGDDISDYILLTYKKTEECTTN